AAAPEVLIARLAAETKRIRFGSGGIMLPNHSALKVAENFRLLEALYPNRIDLGIGRAPGGDRLTASVLNPANEFNPSDYIRQIDELKGYLEDKSTPGTIHEKVRAIPRIETIPQLWMLTSSGESAYIAAHFGLALSYAKFINPNGGPEAIEAYRKQFKPSATLSQPQASVGVFVFCADSQVKVDEMQAVMDYRMLNIERGRVDDEAPSYESVKNNVYSPEEKARIHYNRARMIFGTPDEVKARLTLLSASFDVDEIVVATFADTEADRLRSYQLLAQAFDLKTV
ncbi:MAG TPA: LLM class flavin-dependent oxidoreductase, partial [Cytophagales bacterium]|nr:LLM class flavin-dependent oxidoreductase [Cytophagales bacterium]